MALPVKFLVFATFAVGFFFATLVMGQECPKPGLQCDPCNIVLCSSQNATPIIISNCSATEQHCEQNGTNFQCVEGRCKNPNDPHVFTCAAPGFFPSAYKCDVAYFCTNPGSVPATECTCSSGEIYNVDTGACETGTCTRPPASCNSTGEQGTLEGTNFCFVCDTNLDAVVFRCPENATEVYEDIDTRGLTCGDYTGPTPSTDAPPTSSILPTTPSESTPTTSQTESPTTPSIEPPTTPTSEPPTTPSTEPSTESTTEPSTESTTQPSTVSTTEPSTESTTLTPTTPPPTIVCLGVGQRIPDPLDCRSYYQCDESLFPVHRTCAPGYIYDRARLGCVRGTC